MGANWVDSDDFANINPGEGGHYSTRGAFGSDTWDHRSPGISEHYGFGGIGSGRASDAATTKDQSVKISVSNLLAPWKLFVRAPAAIVIDQPGYYVSYNNGAGTLDWYSNGTFNGNPNVTMPTGAGTVELRCVANVCTLYVNGTLLYTRDFTTLVITTDDAHQGFGMGSDNTTVITAAEGGDYPASTGGGTTPVSASRSTTWNVASSITTVAATRATTWNVAVPATHVYTNTFTQVDGAAAGFTAYPGGFSNVQVVGNRLQVTSTTAFFAYLTGINGAGDTGTYQIDFDCSAPNVVGSGSVGISMVSAGGDGWQYLIANSVHIYSYTAGVRSPYLTNDPRSINPVHVTVTRTVAGATRVYLNGVQISSLDIAMPSSASAATLLVYQEGTAYPTETPWLDNLVISDQITGPPAPSTNVTATRSTVWNVAGGVTATRSTLWTARAAVGSSRVTTWFVRTVVTASTRSTTWTVRAVASSSRSTTWRAAAGVSAARSTTWNVAGVLLAVTTTRSTTWTARAVASSSRSTTWFVRQRVAAAERPTSWAVLVPVGATRSTTWSTRQLVASARSTTWHVIGVTLLVSASRVALWAVRQRTSASRATSWAVAPSAPAHDYLTLYPDSVLYLGAHRIVRLYQGELQVWP
jgi:hypothetical protein